MSLSLQCDLYVSYTGKLHITASLHLYTYTHALAFRQTHFFFLGTDLWKHKASLSHIDIHKATLLGWNNTEEKKPAIQTHVSQTQC